MPPFKLSLTDIYPPKVLKRFPVMPCMKRVYKDKNATVHWSAAKNEGRFSSCWFNAGFVPVPVYIGFRLFVLLGRLPGQLPSNPRGQAGRLSPGNPPASRPGPTRPAPPRRRASPRPDSLVVCPVFGLHKFPDMPCTKKIYGRFPKFHRGFLGRYTGTLKSDIVSKRYTQFIVRI